VSPGSTLALGRDLHEDALAAAHRVAAEQRARIVRVGDGGEWGDGGELPLLARGGFQRANFALARVAAQAYLETIGMELSAQALGDAALHTAIPGRMQVEGEAPLTVLDGAHNPDAVASLAGSLPELLRGRRLGLVLGVLEDKDAASMLGTLLPLCERAWFTAPPSARALSVAALQSLARQQGFENVVCEPRPRVALDLAWEWARDQPEARAVLATGSIYLVGELLGEALQSRQRRVGS